MRAADDLKLLSTAEYLLNVPSSYLFGIATLLLTGGMPPTPHTASGTSVQCASRFAQLWALLSAWLLIVRSCALSSVWQRPA